MDKKRVKRIWSWAGEVLGQTQIHDEERLLHELSIFFERVKIRESYQILDWTELNKDVRQHLKGIYAVCMQLLDVASGEMKVSFSRDDIAWVAVVINNYMNDVRNRIQTKLVHGTNQQTALYQIAADSKEKMQNALMALTL